MHDGTRRGSRARHAGTDFQASTSKENFVSFNCIA